MTSVCDMCLEAAEVDDEEEAENICIEKGDQLYNHECQAFEEKTNWCLCACQTDPIEEEEE